jgi:hypothetical protein
MESSMPPAIVAKQRVSKQSSNTCKDIGKNDALGADILHGKVSMLFFALELLERQDFHRVLASDVYTEHFRVVVIDEADCISCVTLWSIDKLAQVRAFTQCEHSSTAMMLS